MKFFIRYSVLLLAFCVMIGHVSAGGDAALDFQYSLNGVYSDSRQVSSEGILQPKRDLVSLKFVPITMRILPGRVTYIEEMLNGEVYRRELWLISSIDTNVNIVVYNFTTSLSTDFHLNATVAALTKEDLHGDTDCPASFIELPDGIFEVTKIDCRDSSNGHHPAYDGTGTCNTLIIRVPAEAAEATNQGSYVFTRVKDRFLIPNVPDGYQFPC